MDQKIDETCQVGYLRENNSFRVVPFFPKFDETCQVTAQVCNRSQFRTFFLPHRFIKIRPSHQRPVSIEFLTICRIPEFPKSEQNRESCGNVRILRERAAVRRKNNINLNKSFGMKVILENRAGENRVTVRVPTFCELFWKVSASASIVTSLPEVGAKIKKYKKNSTNQKKYKKKTASTRCSNQICDSHPD